jgi:putative transcriptional regulator
MAQVLHNKNLATRFQIMVEIAANQPNIQQKDIAIKIGVTSQAVSDYMNKLEKDGWITSEGRSRYHITKEGINWMLKSLRQLQQYSNSAERVLTNITTWAAVASVDLDKNQTVSLEMRAGLLYALLHSENGATGITAEKAKEGEDIGIMDIQGIVKLDIGQVTMWEIPTIQNGGSRKVDVTKLKKGLEKGELTGAIGVEAIVTLRRMGLEPDYLYGVPQAAIEAAKSGLSFFIVCTGSEAPGVVQKLITENIKYTRIDARKKR